MFKKKEKPFRFQIEIDTAATWWAENLGSKSKQDNGDLFMSMFKTMMVSDIEITEEQKQVFFEALRQELKVEMERAWNNRVTLDVDYSPDFKLATAAAKTDIDEMLFPMKTTMWIEPGKVSVSCGYRAPVEYLLNKSKEELASGEQPGNGN